jgi:peroxiredoxin Q/BCP
MFTRLHGIHHRVLFLLGFALATATIPAIAADAPPKVDAKAADFELPTLSGDKFQLSKAAASGPVVLVVLRGYPGYQCPICNRQVGEFLQQAEKFKTAGASVVFVYPGPAKDLRERAQEFYRDKTIPDHFHLLIDADYAFTNRYGLRWEAPRETAYPAAFLIDKELKVKFEKVSDSHGGRTKPEELLKLLSAKN